MQLLEQRRHKRYRTPETAFLVNDNAVFRLLDISSGGLCFRCLEKDAFPDNWSASIFIGPLAIHIQDLDMRVIWQKPDHKPSFMAMPTKEVGVEFRKLSQSVKKEMEELLLQDLLIEV